MSSLDLPKYEQVKRSLTREIESGRWAVGAAFPSEAQLLKQFDVSRPTLIRALQDLVRSGYLDRQQGRGTFVASRRMRKEEQGLVLPVFLSDNVAGQVGDAREVQLRIFQGIQAALTDRSIADLKTPSMVIHQLPHDRLDEATTRFIDGWEPGPAFVIEPSFNEALCCFLAERDWQVWGLNEPVEGGSCVYIDQERAGFVAAQYLISEGCRRIALLNGPVDSFWGFAARLRGYRRALEEAGLAFDPALALEANHELDTEAGRMMFRMLRESGKEVDGIVGATDLKAMGAMAAALEAGMKIPGDLRFVGIDDTVAPRSSTPLPAVAMPFVEVGRQAVRQAFNTAGDDGTAPAHLQVCLQPTLVERFADP